MAYETARDRYVSDGAGVVPQPRLLVMLYDRLVLDLEQAETALEAKQVDVANDKLVHAQSIILELHTALDHEAWEGAAGLSQLYMWFHSQLIDANIRKQADPVRSCLGMVRELQQAWHRAYQTVLSQQHEQTQASARATVANVPTNASA